MGRERSLLLSLAAGVASGAVVDPFRVCPPWGLARWLLLQAFKPTSTIGQLQNTVTRGGEETTLRGKGRHDPCVLPRAAPMVEVGCRSTSGALAGGAGGEA